jgi:hypothetical protein
VKTEPAVDRPALGAHLLVRYGLAVRRLAFLPAGHGASAYAVEAAGGGRGCGRG